MDSQEIRNQIETLLFISKHPLKLEDISYVLNIDKDNVAQQIEELKKHYAQHGIQILEIANGYCFSTRQQYKDIVEKFVHSPVEVSLSPAALEALSIIAYRQPVSKSDIESIRGVNSDAVLKSLIDKDLVEEVGRGEGIGRPVLYGTTDSFLRHFGLKNLEALAPLPGLDPKQDLAKLKQQKTEIKA